MVIVISVLVAVEAAATLLFGAHTSMQLVLARAARRGGCRPVPSTGDLPVVTIQLPVFNEKYVAAALLRSVAAVRYPRDRLQVQVLDDSTDETLALVAAGMAELTGAGIDAQHVRRPGRHGFNWRASARAHPGLRGARWLVFFARVAVQCLVDDLREDVGVRRGCRSWGGS